MATSPGERAGRLSLSLETCSGSPPLVFDRYREPSKHRPCRALGRLLPDLRLNLAAIVGREAELLPKDLQQLPFVLRNRAVLERFLGDRAVDPGPILEHLFDDLGLDPVLF